MTIALKINNKTHKVNVEKETPLLWVLRDVLHLNGTKFSCGSGLCGSCTVLVNGKPAKSCVLPISQVATAAITTIEGVSPYHPVMKAWKKMDVPQCGYCQSGQILSAVALLDKTPNPTEEQVQSAMINLCRCGSYPEIKKAVDLSVELKGKEMAS